LQNAALSDGVDQYAKARRYLLAAIVADWLWRRWFDTDDANAHSRSAANTCSRTGT
jgi:hypothetical protein